MNSIFMINYLRLARLNQPIGIFLLFLPCLFGLTLAAKEIAEVDFFKVGKFIFLFLTGSIVMRSAGCVINDIFDYKFDREVARTKNRPLASGAITRKQAVIFLAFLMMIGLVILLQFNLKTILSGIFAVILLTTYPLMKRFTYYPQVFLGFTFNFGIVMSCLALLDKISLNALVLYFATIIWTLIYDTIYAFQDVEDDLRIGVKSSALKFYKNPKRILMLLNFAMFLILLFLGWHAHFRPMFFIIILLASFLLDFKISKCDLQNSANCLATFKANLWVGLLILLAIILG